MHQTGWHLAKPRAALGTRKSVPGLRGECYPAPTFPHKQRFLGWVAALCNGLHDQRVVVNRSFSNRQPVTSQVSQGLMLGPALFNNFTSGVDEGSNPADIC